MHTGDSTYVPIERASTMPVFTPPPVPDLRRPTLSLCMPEPQIEPSVAPNEPVHVAAQRGAHATPEMMPSAAPRHAGHNDLPGVVHHTDHDHSQHHGHHHDAGHAHDHDHGHSCSGHDHHAHDHGHDCSGHGLLHHHHDYTHQASQPRSRRALKQALAINVVFLLAEVLGGWLFNSVSLLSDAAHMLMDVGALALALIAASLAARPTTSQRTYGYARIEILAALINAGTLILASIWIIYEALQRLMNPVYVDGAGVIVIAIAGLGANAWATWLLARADRDNPNIRAAMLHSLMDAVSSVGVIVAGLIIATTGITVVDPLAGFLIAGLSIAGTWGVLRTTLNSLLDAAPQHADASTIASALLTNTDVVQVHDVHVWEIGPRQHAVTAHVLINPAADVGAVIERLDHELRHHHGLDHVTLQVAHDRSRALLPVHQHMHRASPASWVPHEPLPL